MAVDAHANFAYSTLTNSPGAAGTTFSVQTGDGALFPAVPFNATVWPAGVRPVAATAEIVRCTARSGDDLTVTRTQEGSTNQSGVAAGYQLAATITKKTLTDVESAANITVDSTTLSGTGTNVQAVFEEIDNLLDAHIALGTDAHDASAVSVLDTGGYYTGTNVETALAELGAGTEMAALPAASVPVSKANTVPIIQSGTVNQATVGSIIDVVNWKAPVRVATNTAGTLATSFVSGATRDGVVLATNDRILIKDQASITENGIYIVGAGTPVRATDFDDAVDELGVCVPVTEGTANAGTVWQLTPGTVFTFLRFGARTKVDVYTTVGAGSGNVWTKPPGATFVQVDLIGGGSGGGSGRVGAAGSDRFGGAGGAPGGRVRRTFPASLLGGTEQVTVGAGGTGGAAKTGGTASDGNPGTANATGTSFGTWTTAAAALAAGAGGTATVATLATAGSFGTDFIATLYASSAPCSGVGGFSLATGTANAGSSGQVGGLPGGGGGGGAVSSANTERAGGAGGVGSDGTGNAGGTGGAVHANGGSATASTAYGGGGGGGGGGGSNAAGTPGGTGSAGSNYGAGGGGGGAGTSTGAGASGAGGDGVQGVAVVTTFF